MSVCLCTADLFLVYIGNTAVCLQKPGGGGHLSEQQILRCVHLSPLCTVCRYTLIRFGFICVA